MRQNTHYITKIALKLHLAFASHLCSARILDRDISAFILHAGRIHKSLERVNMKNCLHYMFWKPKTLATETLAYAELVQINRCGMC